MNKLQLSRILMIATIILIAGFQGYWLVQLYHDEKKGLKKEADVLFKSAIYNLQMNKFRNDTLLNRSLPGNLFLMDAMNAIRRSGGGTTGRQVFINTTDKVPDSIDTSKKNVTKIFIATSAEKKLVLPGDEMPNGEMSKIIFRSSLGDSLSIQQIDSAYRGELDTAKINVNFTIVSRPARHTRIRMEEAADNDSMHTEYITVGLAHPIEYRAELNNSGSYLLGKITYPILVSLLLISLTTASFIFLYRNLLAQKRLTNIKNDFISNITHELKTPIATVNVAIEALRSFNAIDNPERTREYLDISSAELQRLSLLVDKVLKLSMFENKDVELKLESFNLKQVIEEVIQTMQLQFNKAKAVVQFNASGNNFNIEADKLHITSVVYNLLDNALKYSPQHPKIDISLSDMQTYLDIRIADNGIGIPPEYQDKIFDKFFRVPHGNQHNIKGYGLGLSYVSHIISKHHGHIDVDSQEGKGSSFLVHLPVKQTK